MKTGFAVAAFLVLVIVVGALFARTSVLDIPATHSVATTTRAVPPGEREYRSNQFTFSILYPQALAVQEHTESADQTTVVFEDRASAQGFQIYILRYVGDQVSEGQFKTDIPSGVRKNVVNGSLDGALASRFDSFDARLGDTREVWILHGGYLYEITSPKALEPLVEQVLETWKFE
jgi:hypothetical protein